MTSYPELTARGIPVDQCDPDEVDAVEAALALYRQAREMDIDEPDMLRKALRLALPDAERQ